MENNKYREINLEVGPGISKSLFSLTANIPKMKNIKAGLLRLDISKSKDIIENGFNLADEMNDKTIP
jgi:hypothetical protein